VEGKMLGRTHGEERGETWRCFAGRGREVGGKREMMGGEGKD
jgi:hypothetical protein